MKHSFLVTLIASLSLSITTDSAPTLLPHPT